MTNAVLIEVCKESHFFKCSIFANTHIFQPVIQLTSFLGYYPVISTTYHTGSVGLILISEFNFNVLQSINFFKNKNNY